jgi:deoxyribonuclease-1-like protein
MIRFLFTILLFFTLHSLSAQQQISFCSWNIANFGKSKHDTTIAYIAEVLRNFDVVAIQEVVAGPGGAQAVARLHDALNRKGAKWDYVISDPTTGSNGQERYAFLWKTSVLKRTGSAFLEKYYKNEIEREPYFITFSAGNKQFTLVSFHAVPKSKQPEREISYFKCLPDMYPGHTLIFAGDFNCPQWHNVFNPLKSMGYLPALKGQKTTLRQQCLHGDCLASEFDNIFYPAEKIIPHRSGIVPFYQRYATVQDARRLSDHVPIFLQFSIK